MRTSLLAAALALLPAAALAAQSFTGKVTAEDGTPLSGVTVDVLSTADESVVTSAVTDGLGVYTVSPAVGTYHLRAQPNNYFPSLRPSYLLAAGGSVTVDFALQKSGEGWRDDFSAGGTPPSGWTASYGATTFASSGNIMLFRTDVFGGSSVYQGVTKSIGSTLSNVTYPYTTIRSSYSLSAGSFGSIQFIFDHGGGWSQRVALIDDPSQPAAWKDRTYPTLSSIDTAFLLQGDGPDSQQNTVDHYYDHIIIHSRDRGYLRGKVRDKLGAGMPGERVEVLRGTYTVAEALSDASGTYEVWVATEPSAYTLRVRKDGFVTWVTDGLSVAGRTQTAADAVLAAPPSGAEFTFASSGSVAMAWSLSTPTIHVPVVLLSTAADFSVLTASGTGALGQMTTTYAVPYEYTTYYFKVKVLSDPDSQYSNVASTYLGFPSSPTAVTLHQGASSNSLRVGWLSPGSEGMTGALSAGSEFRVQWSSLPFESTSWSTANAQVVVSTGPLAPGLAVSTEAASLPSLSTVSVRVWAQNSSGLWSAASASAAAGVSPFSLETVAGTGGDAGTASALAVDRVGDLHVVYSNGPGLTYIKRTAGVWGAPAVGPAVDAASVFMALDLDGGVHVVYQDNTSVSLAYAKYAGSWSSSTIEAGATRSGAVAVDPRGRVLVSYSVYADGDLKFAQNDGSGWVTEVVDAAGAANNGVYNRIALDGAGNPHIAYALPTGGSAAYNLKYASRTAAGAWVVTELQGTPTNSVAPSLALNGDGHARINFYGGTAGTLRQIRYDGGAWSAPADIDLISNNQNALALDGAGNLHAAYTSGAPADDLKYGYSADGVSWSTRTVDSLGNVGWPYMPIAVDGSGDVHIAYRDTTNTDLKAAHWVPGGFSPAFGGGPGGKAQGPSALEAQVLGPSSVTWRFIDGASNELGYRLYVSSRGSPNESFSVAVATTILGPVAGTGSEGVVSLLSLTPNTSYQAYVAAVGAGGVVTSSVSAVVFLPIEAPTAVVFDEISTRAITASAYAPGPAYSSMTVGLSGTNIALAGNYQGWHGALWTTKASLLVGGQVPMAAASGGKIYVVGVGAGYTGNQIYDPVTDAWTGGADQPTGRSRQGLAAVGGKLYSVGGYDDTTVMNANEEYDPESNSWSVKRAMPTPRWFLAAQAMNGMVYAVGGTGGTTANEAYDPATDTWTTKASMPGGMSTNASAVAGGKLYLLSGSTNREYDPGADAWALRSGMPSARTSLTAASLGGKVYAIGGSGPLKTVEVYDPGSNSWAGAPGMPTARSGLVSAVTGGRIYALAGFPVETRNEAFDPGVASSFTALTPNTLYGFTAKARNFVGAETAESPTVSTYTLAFATMPQAGTPLFSDVNASSLTVSWSSGTDAGGYNGAGATYLVQASTTATFLPVAGSSLTGNVFATVPGLHANATHYFRVRAYNSANVTNYSWLLLGSTVTAIEAPQAVVFDEVSTRSITAAAYASSAAFTGMTAGASGVNVAMGGSYQGWRAETWTSLGSLTARSNLAAAAVGGRLYALGGRIGVAVTGLNEEYDPVTDAWTPRAPLPTPRERPGAAAAAGRIYVIGGKDGGNLTANEEYDPVSNAWTVKAPMLTAREGLAVAAVGERVFALGGTGATEKNEEYDTAGDAWTTRAVLPTPRSYLAAAAVGGKVYAIGGLGGTSVTEAFDPATGFWQARAAMPTARYLLAAAAVGGKVYALGGTTGILNANEVYDPTADVWAVRTVMPTARNDLAAAALGGRVHAVGGYNGAASPANERFDPGIASSFTALTPNTLYAFKAKARNRLGVETAESPAFSTYTLAAATVPQGGAPVFSPVHATSITVNWSSGTDAGGYNGAGARYLLQASTLPAFAGVAGSSETFGTSAELAGLAANATHYFRVRAFNSANAAGDWFNLGTTVTLANPALSAPTTFTMVGQASMTVAWDANSNAPGTRYDVVFTTYLPFTAAVTVSTDPYGTPSVTGNGLLANVTYYPLVFVFNRAGVASGETALGSTVTHIETPTSVVIDGVSTHSVVAVASAPAYSSMTVGLSGVNIALDGAYQGWVLGSSVTVSTGLAPNTLHSFKARARNSVGMETGETVEVSTYTLAFATVAAPGAPSFPSAFASSVAVQWASGTPAGGYNGVGASYLVEASTMDTYAPVLASSATRNPYAVVPGLSVNATHYFRLRAFNSYGAPGGWVVLGATATAIEAPTAVYFDAVASNSIVAVASAPAGSFTNLSLGSSAVNIALGGAYAGFVSGSSTAFFGGLTPDTSFAFKAKARNQDGRETAETVEVSTYTLAAVPSTATPSFTAVGVSSATVQWTGNGNPAGTQYRVEASTAADWSGADDLLSAWFAGTSTAAAGLAVNTTYHWRAQARNAYGAQTDWQALGSTATLAAVPGSAASIFSAVAQSSLTLAWALGGNPADTQFLAFGSTSAAFDGQSDVLSGWLAGVTTGFTGLSPDTTYYWRVRARNRSGLSSAPLELGAQPTLAFLPGASTEPFHRVWAASATVQWAAGGNPASTLYEAQLSTDSAFGGELASSGWVAFLSTTVTGLTGDATYYLRARARGAAGVETAWAAFGSSPTAAADPSGVSAESVGPGSLRAWWASAGNREGESPASWAVRTSLPAALERHGTALLNGRLYAVGGVVGGAPTAEVWSAGVSPAGTNGAWRREADLPAARESLALTVFAGRLYAVGGFEGSPKATVYSAEAAPDGRLSQWRGETSLPAARTKLAAVAYEGWLYALGGDNGVVSQAAVYRAPIRFDGELGAWAASTPLPAARNGHAAAVSRGRVYVAGGLGAGVEDEVWSAPLQGPAVGTWRVETPLPVPVFRHALLASGGALLSVGGHDGTAAVAALRSARLLSDGVVGAWEALNPLPLARFGHGAALETENVFVTGGADDSFVSANVLQAPLGGTQYLLERAQDAGFSVDYASSGWRAGASAEAAGLTPNSTYFLRLRVRARSGLEGAAVVSASTLTPAAIPGAAASTFTLVEAASVTLTWAAGGNPAGTEFLAAVSTSSDFTTALVTGWTTAVSSAVHGLTPNTTYQALVLARDWAARETRPAYLGSTVTAAAVPAAPSFPTVLTTGLSVAWSTAGNPADTLYEAQLSAAPSFAPLAASSVTVSSGASFTGLLSGTTYHLRVRAFNRLGLATAFSASTDAVTGADFTAPDAVGAPALHATETPGVLRAAWTAPGDDGPAGVLPAGSKFYLQWSAADPASVAWSTANAQLAPSTGPVSPGAGAGVLVTGLPVGSSVYARVWAADESANVSAPSSVAAVWASPFTLTRLDGSGSDAGRWASVALDHAGDAHAAYTAGTVAQELRYLKRSGGVWSVAEAPDSGIPAEEAVLALGPGTPQVVYRNSSTGDLRLAKRSSGWVAATVASGDLHPGGLAVDATAHAHISFFDAALPGLRYARWNGTSWDLETVDVGAGRGRFSSLALDGASAPHIAYYDAGGGDLKYASRTAAGTWSTATVDAGVDAGSVPVVALDGAGNAAVAYVDYASKDLKLARYDGTAWVLSPIDTARDVTGVRGLALDGAGRPAVTYYDGTDGDLVFGRFDGSGWRTGAAASYGDVGAWSGLAVESDGGLLEVHYDAGAGDLVAGTWAAGLPGPAGGNPRGRAQAPSAFGGVVASSVGIQWTWVDTAADELGWRLYGGPTSTGPFTVVAGTAALPASAGTGIQRVYTENGLTEGTTYFRYVAAVSSGGVALSPMAALFPYVTADLTAPSVTVNQAGDLVWRRAAGTLYNVDFTDTGGSALDRFSVKASTVPGGVGPDLVAFTDVAAGILADTYTADWALPAGVFAALADGATNYITVRVVDGNANAATQADVFKVLKDTTPPTFADAQADDPVRRAAGGTLYDVDAFDPASGLERFQYSVSTQPGSADQGAVAWTDIPLEAGTTGYQADWTLAFAGLRGDATNYVSLRAWDRAGSTAPLTDAFFVVKDTGGPRVAVLQPAAAVRSVLTALSGTADDAAGVGGVQVAVQEGPPGGVWYDGAGFTSGVAVWLPAAGTAAWTFAGAPAWVDGSSYRVVARASDTLGNFSVLYATSDFSFDASTPAAAVTVPADGAALASLPALSGTAADVGSSPSGLALIEVRLQRAADAFYWNWTSGAWASAAASTSAPLASPWSVAVPTELRANLASGASYFVSARASDNAVPANVGSFSVGSTFTWTDSTPPAAISGLSALTGDAPREILLAWTAPGDDGAADDLALGTYRIHYATDPATAFSSAAAQVEFSTAGLRPGLAQGRVVTGLISGATYYLRVFLADDAGNWSPVSNGATAYARNQPFNKIVGHVMKSSSQGVTGVLLEAYDASELRVSTAASLADSSGTYSLSDLPDGVFRVLATWTAGEVTSSVWLDGIPMGTSGVDFMLEIQYTLSTLTGTLAALSAQSAAPAGFLVRAAEGGFSDARVDLLQGGRSVATVSPDPTGRWTIPNLLPGKYAVRAFNGLDYTEPQPVDLGEGETQEVVFVFDPLPEASVFAFPNPARAQTTFRFVSALPGLEAQVTVFDIAGALVRELPGSAFTAKPGGVYHSVWDLTNDEGESVASGVYLFMVKVKGSNGQSAKVVKKLAVVR